MHFRLNCNNVTPDWLSPVANTMSTPLGMYEANIKQPLTPSHWEAGHSIARGYRDSGTEQSSLVFPQAEPTWQKAHESPPT